MKTRNWKVVTVVLLLSAACTDKGNVGVPAGSEGGPCYGNGTCDASLTCNSDNICEQASNGPCGGVTCSTHGTCAVISGNTPICVCDTGYHDEGLECVENNGCSGVTCSGHGTCIDNNGPECDCEPGFHAEGLACVEDSPACGNGVAEQGEMCDGSNLDGNDCTTIGQGFTGGTLACNGSCQWDTSGCTTENCSAILSDDFEDGTVNPWIIDDGNVSVVGGRLLLLRTGTGYGRVRQWISWSGAFEFEADIQLYTDQSRCMISFADGNTWAYTLVIQTMTQNGNLKGVWLQKEDGTKLIQQLFDPGTSQQHNLKVTRTTNGSWELFLNGGSIGTATDFTYSNFDNIRMIGMQDSMGGHGGYFDNIELRNCTEQ